MALLPDTFYTHWPISEITMLKEHGDQILISALFFQFVFLIGAALSKSTTHYTKLSAGKQANWCIHIVSMTFSCIILLANIPLFSIPELIQDKFFGTDLYARRVFAFTTGFFMWDLAASVYYFEDQGPAFVFHSVACFLVFLASLTPFAEYYGGYFLLFETSTIFLNIHWFCDKTGRAGTKLQWINGIVLLSVFFVTRLIFGTYQMIDFAIDGFAIRHNAPVLYWSFCSAAFGLGSLNFYWFWLMIKSVVSRFMESKQKKIS